MAELSDSLTQKLYEEIPDLEIEKLEQRSSLDFSQQLLIFWATIGTFNTVWKVVELWLSKQGSTRIKISYVAENGSNVEIEYNNQSRERLRSIIRKHPPKVGNPARLSLLPDNRVS